MKTNIGTADKIVRVLMAMVIVLLYFTHQITGIAAIVLLVVAGVLLLTSAIGLCPLYLLSGISTTKKENQASKII